MPVKNITQSAPASQCYKNLSFETLAASWFSGDGWEVLIPMVDHGKKTDFVIADDSNYYRIQIKTVDATNEDIYVENKWSESAVDYVIFFSRDSRWGYITKAFKERKKKLNAPEHLRFHQHHKQFLKAFAKI
jgi:hypothetical protein